MIDAPKSGFHFVQQFAEWTKIQAIGLDSHPQFFTDQSDEPIIVNAGNNGNVAYDRLSDDPAILPQ